jgi:hypothetical protein
VVSAGSCNLDRSPPGSLPADVGEIGAPTALVAAGADPLAGRPAVGCFRPPIPPLNRPLRPLGMPTQHFDHLAKGASEVHHGPTDKLRLSHASRRHDDRSRADNSNDRKDSGYRADGSVQPELTDEAEVRHGSGVKFLGGYEEADGDRQIEAGSSFAHARRREVDGDAPHRPWQSTGEQRSPHAVTSLPAGCVGQADNGESGKTAAHMNLNQDPATFDPEQRCGLDSGDHETTPPVWRWRHGGPTRTCRIRDRSIYRQR